MTANPNSRHSNAEILTDQLGCSRPKGDIRFSRNPNAKSASLGAP